MMARLCEGCHEPNLPHLDGRIEHMGDCNDNQPTLSEEFVDLGRYPQLRLICWNHREPIRLTRREAFGKYEGNWRFVDRATLESHEAAFIQDLADEFGKGLING